MDGSIQDTRPAAWEQEQAEVGKLAFFVTHDVWHASVPPSGQLHRSDKSSTEVVSSGIVP
jgi:hypothetical protein